MILKFKNYPLYPSWSSPYSFGHVFILLLVKTEEEINQVKTFCCMVPLLQLCFADCAYSWLLYFWLFIFFPLCCCLIKNGKRTATTKTTQRNRSETRTGRDVILTCHPSYQAISLLIVTWKTVGEQLDLGGAVCCPAKQLTSPEIRFFSSSSRWVIDRAMLGCVCNKKLRFPQPSRWKVSDQPGWAGCLEKGMWNLLCYYILFFLFLLIFFFPIPMDFKQQLFHWEDCFPVYLHEASFWAHVGSLHRKAISVP